MAHTIGKPGVFNRERTVRYFEKIFIGVCIAELILGVVIGFGIAIGKLWFLPVFTVLGALILFIVNRWTNRVGTRLIVHRKGYEGEDQIAAELEKLPDTFWIIHGLSLPNNGDIDHLVIGPTGVFCIDTKNWAGAVTSNGSRELLINGTPTDKPEASNFIARTTELRKAFTTNGQQLPFFCALFVFPRTTVNIPQGTTGHLDCVTQSQLVDFILHRNRRNPPSPELINNVVAAAANLACSNAG